MSEESEKRHEWFDRMKGARRVSRALLEAIEDQRPDDVVALMQSPELELNLAYMSKYPLQVALDSHQFQTCKHLVDHGADVNVLEDKAGRTLLLRAVQGADTEAVRFLLDQRADPDIADQEGETALSCALAGQSATHDELARLLVTAGADTRRPVGGERLTPLRLLVQHDKPGLVGTLLEGGADIDDVDLNRKSALHFAVEQQNEAVARELLKRGCSVSLADRYGCTALWYAAQCGSLDLVSALLEAGAPADQADHRGSTPFMESVRGHHLAVASALAARGCDVSSAEREHLYTPLHAAILAVTQLHPFRDNVRDEYVLYHRLRAEQLELVQLVVGAGSNLAAADRAGFTPLHHAAFGGDADIVDLLLARGATVNAQTRNGDTSLQLAAYATYPEVVQLLLNAGAEVNLGNTRNETPLYTAIEHNTDIQVLDLLIAAGSETEVREKVKGQTPLFAAIKAGHAPAVERLIKEGVDVNQTNRFGDTALWVACESGRSDMVKSLLRHPRIDVDRGVAHVPLHAAVVHGHEDVVKQLFDAGCRINKLSDLCVSALYYAADVGHESLCRALIAEGADPQAHHHVSLPAACCRVYRDSHPHLEQEPLQAAIRNDNFSLVKLMLAASPRMPYRVLGLMRDILFRTHYARDAHLSAARMRQYSLFFAAVLGRPRSLREIARGVVRMALGERPVRRAPRLPLPPGLIYYVLLGAECGTGAAAAADSSSV